MISQALSNARTYEEEKGPQIPKEQRPLFHLTPFVGWMNDPNGFSVYNGMYHLFYQYYPFEKKWGPMHWGHAVSKDLLHWDYLPAVIAPDITEDISGCFSGGAVELEDGKHLVIYTGVGPMKDGIAVQTQCLAISENGSDYVKYAGNPVIDHTSLPDGGNGYDFRDPKIWKEADGSYTCVTVEKKADGNGRVVRFNSPDGYSWSCLGVLAENDGTFGKMWECPDFFPLDGTYVLMASPMDMEKNDRYYSGNGNLCLTGDFDEASGTFIPHTDQPVDCGIDFYATQSICTEDGRRIMLAWMQNWDTITFTGESLDWMGQITVPRELHISDGVLIQTPIRELEPLRHDPVHYEQVLSGDMTLPGIQGRTIDLLIELRPDETDLKTFEIRFAEDGKHYTSLKYRPDEKTLTFDRSSSGTTRNLAHIRSCHTEPVKGVLSLRILLDRFSCEVFINGGRQVMSHVLYTDTAAEGISFHVNGCVPAEITKYDLSSQD